MLLGKGVCEPDDRGMNTDVLFENPPNEEPSAGVARTGAAFLRYADRDPYVLLPTDLNPLVPPDLPARAAWTFVEEVGPMVGPIEKRFGKTLAALPVGGGLASHDEIERVTECGPRWTRG